MRPIYLLCMLLLPGAVSTAQTVADGAERTQQWCFRENAGQVKDQWNHGRNDIQFQLSVNDLSVFIGSGSIYYQWNQVTEQKPVPLALTNVSNDRPQPATAVCNSYRMDVQLLGCNTKATIIREDILPGEDIYYAYGLDGARAKSWRRITYKNIYPNIDWVLYLKGATLKYDFIVYPGGKVSDIRLQYRGASSLKPEEGGVVATTPMGSIKEEQPHCYTLEDGKIVASRFVLDNDILQFVVDGHTGTLVIDPELRLQWGTYYGGQGAETGQYGGHSFQGYYFYGNTVTTDHKGDVYLSGTTSSFDNIATTGTHQQTFSGGSNAYLVKFNAAGQRLWGTYFGGYKGSVDEEGFYIGTASGRGHSIACDTLGNVYMTGNTWSDSGIATPGAFQTTRAGIYGWPDLYLAKFNGDGIRQWSTYFGNPRLEEGGSLAITRDGSRIYFSGTSQAFEAPTDVVATPGAFIMPTPGAGSSAYSGFLTCFNPLGQRQWGTYIADVSYILSTVYDITLDNQGSIFLTGYAIGGTPFDTISVSSPGSFQSQYGGCISGSFGPPNCVPDAFLQKWDSLGNRLWGTYYGGNYPDGGHAVVCDDSNNVYLAGYTSRFDWAPNGQWAVASQGSLIDTIPPGGGSFLAKFSGIGQRLWATYYYGNDRLGGSSLAYRDNKIFLLVSSDTGNIATPCAYQTDNSGLYANSTSITNLLSIFDKAGNREYATFYGGQFSDWGSSLTTAPSEEGTAVYVTGITYSPTGISTPGSFKSVLGPQLSLQRDAFLSRFLIPIPREITMPCFSRDSVRIIASDTLGNNYNWEHGDTGFGTWVSTSGTYIVHFQRANGCPDADTFRVSIYPLPVLSTVKGCKDEGIAAANVGKTNRNEYTYDWYTVSGTLLRTLQSDKGDTLVGQPVGDYRLQISAGGCDTTLSFSIENYPGIQLTISNDTTIIAGQKVQLHAGGASMYRWQPEQWLDNPSVAVPVAAPPETITYVVRGYNEYGCSAVADVTVAVRDLLFMPNAFSPNGDGINDEFRIGHYGYYILEAFRIFNRWGEEVFFTDDPLKGWNGFYKGRPSDLGIYHYYIRMHRSNGEPVTLKGDVSLIR